MRSPIDFAKQDIAHIFCKYTPLSRVGFCCAAVGLIDERGRTCNGNEKSAYELRLMQTDVFSVAEHQGLLPSSISILYHEGLFFQNGDIPINGLTHVE